MSPTGYGVSRDVITESAKTVFCGELMTCAICRAIQRSAPDRNSQWRGASTGRRAALRVPDALSAGWVEQGGIRTGVSDDSRETDGRHQNTSVLNAEARLRECEPGQYLLADEAGKELHQYHRASWRRHSPSRRGQLATA